MRDARAHTFRSARDSTLCLDVFYTDVARLGAYWCHGGANQQFRSRAPTGGDGPFCSLDGKFCVAQRATALGIIEGGDAARPASYYPLANDGRRGCDPSEKHGDHDAMEVVRCV